MQSHFLFMALSKSEFLQFLSPGNNLHIINTALTTPFPIRDKKSKDQYQLGKNLNPQINQTYYYQLERFFFSQGWPCAKMHKLELDSLELD